MLHAVCSACRVLDGVHGIHGVCRACLVFRVYGGLVALASKRSPPLPQALETMEPDTLSPKP